MKSVRSCSTRSRVELCHIGWATLALVLIAAVMASAQEEKLVTKVEIEGEDYIAEEVILSKMETAVGRKFSQPVLDQDRQRILGLGYFQDVQATTNETDEGVEVKVVVVERQRIRGIEFRANTVIPDEELNGIIATQVGQPSDLEVIRRDVRRIQDHYSDKGYLCNIEDAAYDPDTGVLRFVIIEVKIAEVRVEGLRKTDEWVVRRELEVKPGELFNKARIRQDLQRLMNLQLFKSVEPDVRPGPDPLQSVILVYNIEEQRTGRISVGAGYSNLDKFVGFVSLSESNFRGKAERVSVSGQIGGRQSIEFSFFKPWLDKHRTAIELSAHDTERRRRFFGGDLGLDDDRYEERRRGGSISVTRPFARVWRGQIGYRYDDVSSAFLQLSRQLAPGVGHVGDVSAQQQYASPGFGFSDREATPPPDNPELLPDRAEPGDVTGPMTVYAPVHGGGKVASLQLGLARDTRDLIARPSQGSFHRWDMEWASEILGGDEEFTKLIWDARWYRRPFRKTEDVVAFRVLMGTAFGDLPLFDAFSVGGHRTLRGYREDRFRGENMFVGSAEYRHALTKQLTVVGFVDAGDAWGGTFKTAVPGFIIRPEHDSFEPSVGVGAGVRVETPLAPIAIDVGFGDEGTRVHFNFGQTW
jgi:outer membrane protein insertion porin family